MISHDFKIFFTHIPKCAGRSVCDIFNQRFDHYTANYYRTEFPNYWSSYHTFTIVRNPFSRYVSLYLYLLEHRRHSKERIMITPGETPSFKLWLKTNINQYQGDFDMNSAEGKRGTDGDPGSSFWFSSQKRRISSHNGGVIVSDIFYLEDGMHKVEKYLQGITGVYATMPHSNKQDATDYRKYYDQELIDLVHDFAPAKEDLELFEYRF